MSIELKAGNIWSGNRELAVFTNPTEIAFRKGNLKNHYPVEYEGRVFVDSEALYQRLSRGKKADANACYTACVTALCCKLHQYPLLIDVIKYNGGIKWLEECSHIVFNKNPRWEGVGRKSGFIRCLITAFKTLK